MINQPVFVWSAIMMLMVVAFVARAISRMRLSNDSTQRRHRFIEIAKERELLYCPGDEWLEKEIDD